MTEWLDAMAYFHFLRPAWLALAAAGAGARMARAQATGVARDAFGGHLAPHLADALTVGARSRRRVLPIDGVVAALVLMSIAAAGPSWSHIPNPLVAQTAPLAVVVAASPSMDTRDIAPSRLERAQQKVLDLLDLRAGARTALIVYAGTAHRVVPLSEDPAVLKPFVEGLSTAVMPSEGRDATEYGPAMAEEALSADTVPGAILFVLDELDGSDLPAFQAHAS